MNIRRDGCRHLPWTSSAIRGCDRDEAIETSDTQHRDRAQFLQTVGGGIVDEIEKIIHEAPILHVEQAPSGLPPGIAAIKTDSAEH